MQLIRGLLAMGVLAVAFAAEAGPKPAPAPAKKVVRKCDPTGTECKSGDNCKPENCKPEDCKPDGSNAEDCKPKK